LSQRDGTRPDRNLALELVRVTEPAGYRRLLNVYSRARVRAVTAILLVSTVVLTGCGGGAKDTMVRTGSPTLERDAQGRLRTAPAPLTLSDVARQKRDTPQRTVVSVLFWAQWGSVSNVLVAYDARVISRLGRNTVADAFMHARDQFLRSAPRIAGARIRGPRATVLVEMYSQLEPPKPHSYELVQRDGGWVVVYDTVLEGALSSNALQRVDPNAPTPNRAALQAAARIARAR